MQFYWLLLIAGFSCLLAHILGKSSFERIALCVLPLTLVLAADGLVFSFFFCVAMAHRQVRGSVFLSLLVAIVAALLSATKMTFAVLAVVALAPATLSGWFGEASWRRRIFLPVTFLVAFSVLWMVAGQSLLGVLGYFLNGLSVASGFSPAMSLSGPRSELLAGLILLIALAGSIFWDLNREWRSEAGRLQRMLAILNRGALICVAWVAFKQGFVRHDGHVLAFVVFSGVATAVSLQRHAIPRASSYLLASIWLALFFMAGKHHGSGAPLAALESALGHLAGQIAAAERVTLQSPETQRDFAAALMGVRNSAPLPAVSGSADFASVHLAGVLAHGIDWRPRPVFQSYSAYTPRLAQLNRDFLRDEARAPRNFFVELTPIDGKHPLQEDALIWRELLERYDLASVGLPLHFVRRAVPRSVSERSVLLDQVGDAWVVPNEPFYDYALLDILPKAGVLQGVVSFLYKPSDVFIEVTLENGEVRKNRFIPSMGGVPFLFSPFVQNSGDYLSLGCLCDLLSRQRVKSFRLLREDGSVFPVKYQPRVTFVSIAINDKEQKVLGSLRRLARLQVVEGPEDVKANPYFSQDGALIRNAHAPSVHRLPAGNDVRRVCFGIRPGVPWDKPEADGVQFVVRTVVGGRVVMSKEITAEMGRKDRLRFCENLPLNSINEELLFDVGPHKSTAYDWAYWYFE